MTRPTISLDLPALDGSNPLGFLAALGTLVTVRRAGETGAALRWRRGSTWAPVLEGLSTGDPLHFSRMLADALRGQPVSDEAEGAREKAERAFDDAKKVVMDRREAIRHRGVRGQEYRAAIEAEIPSLERVRDEKRREWLTALARAVPRPELAIGKRIDCPASEYRDHARALLADAHAGEREPLDLLAAFASDACVSRFDQIAPTPFCFVTGSGHQYFLDTVRQLMELVQPERVMRALVEPWEYDDARLSLRWDPIEASA